MKIVILAGGGGTRLFPLSRSCFPKQFLKVNGEKSLLLQTVERFLPMIDQTDLIVITNRDYLYHVKTELALCHAEKANVILEPSGRNTAPAIALAMAYCRDVLACDEEEVMLVTPADHIIETGAIFKQCIEHTVEMARTDRIVTLGIKPTAPETGYGYIEVGKPVLCGYEVASFKEKPQRAVAETYLAAGNYYWNSGMFVFSLRTMREELRQYQAEIASLMAEGYDKMQVRFEELPDISIDYAVAELSQKVSMVPLTSYWNDVGTWDAIYDILPKDGAGNAVQGDAVVVDCEDTLIIGRDRLIAGIGLKDLLVVETDDVIVVTKKGESEKIKNLVQQIKKSGRKEADENTTMYRPWGSYTVLGEGDKYKMKKIVVLPGGRLSLQMHYHRSEHWVVVSGTAEVTIGEEVKMVRQGESVFIPKTVKHRLANPGKLPLEIIEVQNGDYLEEDDIVRFDDVYGRV